MKKEDVLQYKNKKVLVKLKNDFVYTGTFIALNDFSAQFIDKFKNNISFDYDYITVIMELRDNEIKH